MGESNINENYHTNEGIFLNRGKWYEGFERGSVRAYKKEESFDKWLMGVCLGGLSGNSFLGK